jgi:hypothetical protein
LHGVSLDPNKIYLPSGEIIRPFAHAFVEAMLAQADLERTFYELQAVISGKREFGKRNRWPAEDRPKRLARLIRDRLGSIPEAAAIRKILKDAIPAYKARNLLAHGHWWSFDPATSTIEARAWHGEAAPRTFTEADIWSLRDQFKDFSAELHKLRFEIERARKVGPRGSKKRAIGTKRRATTSCSP